ncbi:unnamed protein product [Polarella glacialis]|uniref:Uncharacterized protein n=1 Tax=Polarella glacialis TaxID=89957 RepID=A0A813LTX6_POLGL|nr:unnamed protein product [Polarella glacialis]
MAMATCVSAESADLIGEQDHGDDSGDDSFPKAAGLQRKDEANGSQRLQDTWSWQTWHVLLVFCFAIFLGASGEFWLQQRTQTLRTATGNTATNSSIGNAATTSSNDSTGAGDSIVFNFTAAIPPYYDHGIFEERDPGFMSKYVYDYNASDMFKLLNVSNPSNDKLVPLMAKIAAGLSTSIVVYGGSETAGNMNKVNFNLRCDAQRRDKSGQFLCGWPERLQQWLRVASGNTDSRVENRAVSGTTSSTFISGLSMILQQAQQQAPQPFK